MDEYLINYLKSGKAWLLVGSGPSIEMGYPSWEFLAKTAIEIVKSEHPNINTTSLEIAMRQKDYPLVFDKTKDVLGGPRLIQELKTVLRPTKRSQIYQMIAQWPISVYITTNYDDEISNHLVQIGESYLSYSNSEDHLSAFIPDLNGAILKLHGDLRSESGLILTKRQYEEIDKAEKWQYLRTKLTSIFQMNRMIIIGYSLTDPHIKHILEAAKKGSGVVQPICWIAPDINNATITEFLNEYRIRLIPYDNQDGTHKNLITLINHISDFIPPRLSIGIKQELDQTAHSPLGSDAAAPGFFVFNKLASLDNYEQKRVDVVIAALQGIFCKLNSLNEFTIEDTLELLGWNLKEISLSNDFVRQIEEQVTKQGLFIKKGNKYVVNKGMEIILEEKKNNFDHLKQRFKESTLLRIKQNYSQVNDSDADQISIDIESSLTGYFRECGLTLATLLYSNKNRTKKEVIPSSIIKYINESSARYDSLLLRQVFSTTATDAFVRGGSAEREYLGRISQGFFAFHALGLFGDSAIAKINYAKDTVWLIDSNIQILALALPAPTSLAFRECINRIKGLGIRLFTTERLFEETRKHLKFADRVIQEKGQSSPLVIAAATGQLPYKKTNQFLAGFIRWQAANNPCDWEEYLFSLFNSRKPDKDDVATAIKKLGIEIYPFEDWPGFDEIDYSTREEIVNQIVNSQPLFRQSYNYDDIDIITEPEKKAQPEAEAMIIVQRERNGKYNILNNTMTNSSAWFISSTSVLNLIGSEKITWQPEAFLRYSATLSLGIDGLSAERAFDTILWSLAQSGLNLLDDKIINSVFGGVIDQSVISSDSIDQLYEQNLAIKYGESRENVLKRINPKDRPMAVIQMANENAQIEIEKRKLAEEANVEATKRAKKAENELEKLQYYRKKLLIKKKKDEIRTKRKKGTKNKTKR